MPFHMSSSLLLTEKDNVPILHGEKQIVKVTKVILGYLVVEQEDRSGI